ncbi:MAG: hypothetical protein KF860_17320 [Cyclobacteriaceae bacterium]|nr:hypothetical protein [Cyclobacteriaceae bacterium]
MNNLKPFKAGDKRINRNGRPKKSIMLESLMSEYDTSKVVAAVYEKAIKGNLQACQLWIDHRFGKPRQSLEVDQSINMQSGTYVEYSNLSEKALKEILANTKQIDNDND